MHFALLSSTPTKSDIIQETEEFEIKDLLNQINHDQLVSEQERKRSSSPHKGQTDFNPSNVRKFSVESGSNTRPNSRLSNMNNEPLVDDEYVERLSSKLAGPVPVQRSQYERTREATWQLWSVPESSTAAFAISTVILILILVSSTTFCLETMKEFDDKASQNFFQISEYVSIACFTMEYVLRLWSAPDAFAFVRSPMNAVDLISILPFYIEIAAAGVGGMSGTRILRVIRLVRVFRILKLGGRFSKMQVVGGAVLNSMDMLGMLGFLLLLSMILFSTLIYFCENGRQPAGVEDQFRSIPSSFWWCIVTLMTVGYGDAVPTTVWGQIVATMAMVASVIILALPISVIGANFTAQWIEFRDQMKLKEQAHHLRPNFVNLVKAVSEHNAVVEELLEEIRLIEQNLARVLSTIRTTLERMDAKDISWRKNSQLKAMLVEVQKKEPTIASFQVPELTIQEEEEVEVIARQLEMQYTHARTLRDMLEERLKQLQLISSEEFSDLMQLCQKLQKTAGRKVEEGRTIGLAMGEVKQEVEEIQELFHLTLADTSAEKG